MKSYQITVDGRIYQVEIEDLSASPIIVRVNGQTFAVTVGQEETKATGAPAPVTPTPAPTVQAPQASPVAVPTTSEKAMICPMPGTIVEIKVKPGDTVAYGDEIGVLEAMKMKSLLRAPRAGTIAEVRVVPGQSVAYGDVLVVFA